MATMHSNKKPYPTRRAAEAVPEKAKTVACFIGSSSSSASSVGSASPSSPPQNFVTPPSKAMKELFATQSNRPKKGATTARHKKESRRRLLEPCISATFPLLDGLPLLRKVEALGCWVKGCLKESGNIKTSVKEALLHVPEMYLALIMEAREEWIKEKFAEQKGEAEIAREREEIGRMIEERTREMAGKVEELIKENKEHQESVMEKMEKLEKKDRKLEELMGNLRESAESMALKPTYAEAVTNRPQARGPERTALHSIVISSENAADSSEDVLNQFRGAADAKNGWCVVEKVKKVKNQKIVVGCKTKEEKERVCERLRKAKGLKFEDLKNKDPLVILRGVMAVNTDEDILTALRKQNGSVFEGLKNDEDRVSIKYKKKTRNPHTQHVVLAVSPILWSRLTERGSAHIDIQRVKVEDQSPLVQCSQCLGYGHSRRTCTGGGDKCSHCGGPHLRAQCAEWKAGTSPRCINCTEAKLETLAHNAFSEECPIRRRWDDVARATIAYC